ncbi:carbohydrate-binding domain-containing protein [Dyadobacter flavalbus]|uniref:Carbohydrate-binding domain-containing protein n=1 Tax=Dyadobacter flavalbus TaxID=2579942 RepID=A0A5M8QTF2_9BACT|nr:carbohydrate-binding domain-containing protein [Dyadobacter flavalbus]KAA6438551.1 carbohydrate-binding domain-containing protein [Dyadobacter flavalbus]
MTSTFRLTHFVNVRIIAFLLATFLISCSKEDESVTPAGTNADDSASIDSVSTVSAAMEGNTDPAADEEDILANSTFSSIVSIQYGTAITITNPLAGAGVSVTQVNGDVTITSTAAEVEYLVSGTTANGSLKIYSDKKFKLTFNGAAITNTDGPAINIQSKKRAFVVLNENTTNTLTDGTSYVASGDEDMKSTLFSEGQLIFSGTGTLNVKGNYKHAICSDDYIRVIGGIINVTGAASDGIHANDAFIADGGTLNITTSGDGIQCEEGFIVINNGSFAINVADKAITANWDTDTSIDPYVTINGGTFVINSSAGEGIESKSTLTINDGSFTIKTADDGLNAGTKLNINGGNLYVYSTSNDGIDSNGPMTITGGKIISIGAASPEEGFDCDRNAFKVTGGIMVGIGGSTSSPTANASTQPSVILGGGSANQIYHIRSVNGAEALTFTVPRTFTTMLFSSPKLKLNTSYNVYTGGSVASGIDYNGLFSAGNYTDGTKSTLFTTSSMVTIAGGSQRPGR